MNHYAGIRLVSKLCVISGLSISPNQNNECAITGIHWLNTFFLDLELQYINRCLRLVIIHCRGDKEPDPALLSWPSYTDVYFHTQSEQRRSPLKDLQKRTFEK